MPSDTPPKLAPARDRVAAIDTVLKQLYPGEFEGLHYANPLQLLVATILSAQCTDARVNTVTPALFARYKTARDFAECDLWELQKLIKSTGFYKNKAQNIRACCAGIVERFGGDVPATLADLITLRGIGRKTANVVLGHGFNTPGVAVDTHVARLSRRLGLTRHRDPTKIERVLMELIPQVEWTDFSHRLITHGRKVCFARKPHCESCALAHLCPKIGVKQLVAKRKIQKKTERR